MVDTEGFVAKPVARRFFAAGCLSEKGSDPWDASHFHLCFASFRRGSDPFSDNVWSMQHVVKIQTIQLSMRVVSASDRVHLGDIRISGRPAKCGGEVECG